MKFLISIIIASFFFITSVQARGYTDSKGSWFNLRYEKVRYGKKNAIIKKRGSKNYYILRGNCRVSYKIRRGKTKYGYKYRTRSGIWRWHNAGWMISVRGKKTLKFLGDSPELKNNGRCRG